VTEEDSVLAVEGVEESPLDVFHEECGVFGVYRHPEAANLAYLGLYAQQHRGQESAGIVSSNGRSLIYHHGMGLVADVFNSKIIETLKAPVRSDTTATRRPDRRRSATASRWWSSMRAAGWRSRITVIS